jgi:hypothetical protein
MATVPLAAFCFVGHAIWPKADGDVVAAHGMVRRLFYAASFLSISQVKRCSSLESKSVCPILDIGIQINKIFL